VRAWFTIEGVRNMALRSREVALGGVMAGLCLVSLFLAAFLPTNKLFFYGLSSVFCSVILIESGPRWAWIFYGATCILGFFIIPNKLAIIPYGVFFGFYGIAKYYIEGIRRFMVELIIKGGLFVISVTAALIIAQELFAGEVYSKLPLWALMALGLVIFYIYDYAYTQFVIYYERVLKKKIT